MRIFISHSTKNRAVVIRFAEFLESVCTDIEVFCSSEDGSITVGKNFIETIFKELRNSDLFIPIISKEYYTSKFCMIELGVAYSYLFNQNNNGEDYIFPFFLYPIQKGQALSGTPLANIQTGDLRNKEDIHGLLQYLSVKKEISIGTGVNRKIHSFIFDINQIFLKQQSIVGMAKIGSYFDDSIAFKYEEDVVRTSIRDNMIVVNYNMNPYNKLDIEYPSFISVALKYVDKLDICHYLDFESQANFRFEIVNFSNSLKRIFVEFKYSDNNIILDTFVFPIVSGKNILSIPLEKMRSNALSNISEICFAIHPDDVEEEEGMFTIGAVRIE